MEAAFRIATFERSRLPELAPALRFLPVKDQPKLAAAIDRAARRADLSRPRALLSAAVRREPARPTGRSPCSCAARRAALLALALLAGPLLAGCSGGSSSESAPDLLAHAKRTLDDAKSAHFVLDSEGAPTPAPS